MRFPNSYGSIIKLSGKRRRPYGVRVTVGWKDEKQVRKYIGYYSTKSEAIQALAEYNANPYDIDSKKITFQEVWEHWKAAEYDEGTRSSQSAWRSGYSHCEPIYTMRLHDIKYTHIKDLLKDKGGSTQSQIKGICSKLFKHAIKMEWTDKNPALHVEIKKDKPKEKKTFTEAEIVELWEKVEEDEFYESVLILLYTGMRITEMLEIKQANVFADYMIGGKKTDAGIDRIIPLHRKIRKFIKKRLDGGEFLFPGEDGGFMDYHAYRNEFMKRIDGHTIHETRHTFASRMHTAGVNEITLKMIIGHAQNDITSKVYIHKQKDELLKAVHRLT